MLLQLLSIFDRESNLHQGFTDLFQYVNHNTAKVVEHCIYCDHCTCSSYIRWPNSDYGLLGLCFGRIFLLKERLEKSASCRSCPCHRQNCHCCEHCRPTGSVGACSQVRRQGRSDNEWSSTLNDNQSLRAHTTIHGEDISGFPYAEKMPSLPPPYEVAIISLPNEHESTQSYTPNELSNAQNQITWF